MNSYALVIVCLLAVVHGSQSRSAAGKGGLLASPQFKDTRIIGGVVVPNGYAPYQVTIRNTFGEHVCGGSIISERFILTAAHCMEWPIEYLEVGTGSNNWTTPQALHKIKAAHVHCLHNKPMYHNDIALLELTEPIVFNNYTDTIKIVDLNTLQDKQPLILTGWGSTKLWGRTPDLLNTIHLEYLEHGKCKKAVRNSDWLGNGHICTFTKEGEGSCHGDSGGPLVTLKGEQVGIVNWGEACAKGYPDVYASVPFYKDWINGILAGAGSC